VPKRPDEKFVTEKACDNPKFVEDIVRDVARRLDAEPRIGAYTVESQNVESIHNHSAYALISRGKQDNKRSGLGAAPRAPVTWSIARQRGPPHRIRIALPSDTDARDRDTA
jgi:hypothetical protein